MFWYEHGADANQAIYEERPSRNSMEPTNGSPPAGWQRPTVEQIKALDSGANGLVPTWLNLRGGFPSRITGEVWSAARSGGSATTVNQSTVLCRVATSRKRSSRCSRAKSSPPGTGCSSAQCRLKSLGR